MSTTHHRMNDSSGSSDSDCNSVGSEDGGEQFHGVEQTACEVWQEKQDWQRRRRILIGVGFLIGFSIVLLNWRATAPTQSAKSEPTYYHKRPEFNIPSINDTGTFCVDKFDDEFIAISNATKPHCHQALANVLESFFTTFESSSQDDSSIDIPTNQSARHDGFSSLVLLRWEPYFAMDMLTYWFSYQHKNGHMPVSDFPSLVLLTRHLLTISQVDRSAPAELKDRSTEITFFLRDNILQKLANWYRYLSYTTAEDSNADTVCHRWQTVDNHLSFFVRQSNENNISCDVDLHMWLTFFAATLHEVCTSITNVPGNVCNQQDWGITVHNSIVDVKQLFAADTENDIVFLWMALFGLSPITTKLLDDLEMGNLASEYGIPSIEGGHVSIDFNYMVLACLFHSAADSKLSEYMRTKIYDVYDLIRERILSNVYSQEKLHQFYDGETGKGFGIEKHASASVILPIETEEYPQFDVSKYLRSSFE